MKFYLASGSGALFQTQPNDAGNKLLQMYTDVLVFNKHKLIYCYNFKDTEWTTL